MPGGDRTGPMGMGAMTGRGMGLCGGYATSGYMQPGWGYGGGFGRGFGRGRGGGGGGRGFRNRFYATGVPGWAWGQGAPAVPYGAASVPYGAVPYGSAPTKEGELDFLKQQADYFQGALEDLRVRMAELEGEEKKG